MSDQSHSRALPDGLVLRTAGPRDLDQIGALLVERGEEGDDQDHQLIMADSPGGWDNCAVVVDGDRVVSTATLLDEQLTLEDVTLSAGQVDLVATDTAYEGRGLVRELMAWAHQLSDAHGHVVQVMLGIPYFYRQFGYTYAIDVAARRELEGSLSEPTDVERTYSVRKAQPADIAGLTALNDRAQKVSALRMPHTAETWRWMIAQDASDTWVVETSTGDLVGSGRTTAPDDEVMLVEATATDTDAAWALLRQARAQASQTLQVADRPGTLAGDLYADLVSTQRSPVDKYYLRLPDVRRLLDQLRPVFAARLHTAGTDLAEIPDGRVLISTFHRHFVLPVVDGSFGPTVAGPAMQAPGSHGGAGIAPDLLGSVLLGPDGFDRLCELHPDVYAAANKDLFSTLLPPVSSDLMTYYIP